MAKLIVIEGIDGAGKQTQAQLLVEALRLAGATKVRALSFPCYDKPCSALVKYYLDGGFGEDPMKVNAYAASACYALDRFGSFVNDWKKDYDDPDTIIVADRYVTSNAIYQAAKFDQLPMAESFMSWLDAFEYGHLGLPRPDMVLFLDTQQEVTEQLIAHRENKFTHDEKKDIHESSSAFMGRANQLARTLATEQHWTTIQCCKDGQMRTREDIGLEIAGKVWEFLRGKDVSEQ